jgi:hypothetical protein
MPQLWPRLVLIWDCSAYMAAGCHVQLYHSVNGHADKHTVSYCLHEILCSKGVVEKTYVPKAWWKRL